MNNMKLFYLVIVLCMIWYKGYSAPTLSVCPQGKNLFHCEYLNDSTNTVSVPSYHFANDNNLVFEELAGAHRIGVIGPNVDFVTYPEPIRLGGFQKHSYSVSSRAMAYFSFLGERHVRYKWNMCGQNSNSVVVRFSDRGALNGKPDLSYLTSGTNVVVALGYSFERRMNDSGSILFQCHNGSKVSWMVPHPLGEGSVLEIRPQDEKMGCDSDLVQGGGQGDLQGKVIDAGTSIEWACAWANVRERIPRHAYDMLHDHGAIELRWRCQDMVSSSLLLWIGDE